MIMRASPLFCLHTNTFCNYTTLEKIARGELKKGSIYFFIQNRLKPLRVHHLHTHFFICNYIKLKNITRGEREHGSICFCI